MRFLVDVAILLTIACLFASTWLVQWFAIPTGSMAPALMGVHRAVTCDDCGYRYMIGCDPPPKIGQRVVCPNCGYTGQQLESETDLAGERVLVARSIFNLRTPRRWEVVAFRSPKHPREYVVKRIAGLPGEAILVRHGDLYVDGRLVRKSLAEQRAVAILVNDAAYEAGGASHAPARWRSDVESTWRSERGHFYYSPRSNDVPTDWLVYHHVRRTSADPNQVDEVPVTDLYGYNQTQPLRDLYPMRDLLLTCRLRVLSPTTVLLRASDGQTEFLVQVGFTGGRVEVFLDGSRIADVYDEQLIPGEHKLALSLIDQQLLLEVDGRQLVEHPFDRDEKAAPSATPFAISAEGAIEIWQLCVWRDIYYTVPPELAQPPGSQAACGLGTPYQLGPGEYFLLGDNSPQSVDSRYSWFGPTVSASMLIGKPCLTLGRR